MASAGTKDGRGRQGQGGRRRGGNAVARGGGRPHHALQPLQVLLRGRPRQEDAGGGAHRRRPGLALGPGGRSRRGDLRAGTFLFLFYFYFIFMPKVLQSQARIPNCCLVD